MEAILWLAVVNWGLLVVMLIYPWAMVLIFKDFVFDGWHGPIQKFRLATKDDTDDPIEPWHAKLWRDWGGVGGGLFMCYRKFAPQTEKHEARHCYQWMVLGVLLFVVAYYGHVLWILVTQKFLYLFRKKYTKHSYYDCWAERDARKYAGQPVDIPPERWLHGKKDIFAWA